MQFEIEKSKKEADEAKKVLEKFNLNDAVTPITEVYKNIGQKFNSEELQRKVAEVEVPQYNPDNKKKGYVTDGMSKLSRNERKLVAKILSIITDNAPKDVAEKIIDKIKEEMR